MLYLGPEAYEELARLADDPSQSRLHERILDVLSILEFNPGDSSVRTVRLQYRSTWGVPVRWADEDWIVIWKMGDEGVSVLYIGRDFR